MKVGQAILYSAAVLTVVWAASVSSESVHDFTERCTLCHAESETEAAGPQLLKAPSAVAHRCQMCHRLAEDSSHPVGMVVKGHMPEEFPLDESGRLTCLTCHYAHPRPEGLGGEAGLLRGGGEADTLCPQCHMQPEGLADHDAHALSFREAHTKMTSEGGSSGGIHDRSAACLSCHNDVGTGGGGLGASAAGKRSDHPIGVQYPSGTGPADDYHPKSSLDPAIRLFDGSVECETCHNLFSHIDSYLVMSNRGSKLCLSCHNK